MNSFISNFQNEKLIERSEDCAIFQLALDKGSGTAIVYPLFYGIEMIVLDINAPQYLPSINKKQNVFEINYCLSGRAECKMDDGCLQYIGQGDIFLTALHNHSNSMEFPLNHYRGIVLYIDLDNIDIDFTRMLLGNAFNMKEMLARFFENDQCFLLQAREATIHFFANLCSIDKNRLVEYYRLKTLELMLYLESIDPKIEKRTKVYTRSQVDVVKQIAEHMTDNLNRRITIDELSQKFCISATALKNLFKEIYGKPISTYMKEYRIQKAKAMLIETDQSILEIAMAVGYESQSKFGAVFRDMTGLTPLDYRRKKQ